MALTDRFEMRTSADMTLAIDEWRGGKRPIPSRAEAIRMLVGKALKAEAVVAEERDGGGEQLAG